MVRYGGNSTAELIQALRDVDVAMVQGHGFDQAAFAHMGLHGRCKGLVSFGHGYDHLDLDAATTNGVVLANTASFGTEEVSNHTMMHFLVCSRKFVLHDKLVRSGVWTRKNLGPMGHIAGQVFGIVGLGDIGRAVARKARAFGLDVIAFDPYVASWDALESGVEMMDSLEELCRRSDYLSVHIYLNAETRHLISRAQFAVMKPSAYVINCSRGGVVDEAALIEALQSEPHRRRRARRVREGAGRPRQSAAQDGQRFGDQPLRQLLRGCLGARPDPARRRGRPHRHRDVADVADQSRLCAMLIPPRTPARSWEVYARELSAGRHR